MKTLYLHGEAEAQFGGPFELDVASPAEALRALCMQLEGFTEMLRDGAWHVIRGALDRQQCDAAAEDTVMCLGSDREIHLLPAIQGAGSGGGPLSIILGVVLVAVAYFFPPAAPYAMGLYAAGAGLIVGGLIQMSMKMPGADTNTGESVDSRSSFLFTGPKNTSTQGPAIPRGYGRCRSGSTVISAGLTAEDLPDA